MAYTWNVEKFLVEELTPLNIFKVPDVLQHLYGDITDRPSLVYPMFSSRDVGAVLHRTNVNGQVKSSTGFESHKDFIHTVARAMLVELALETLGLDDKTSAIQLPENIKKWKNTKKLEWLDGFVKHVVDVILKNFSELDMTDVNMFVAYQGQVYNVTAPAHYRGKTFDVDINGNCLTAQDTLCSSVT